MLEINKPHLLYFEWTESIENDNSIMWFPLSEENRKKFNETNLFNESAI